MARAIYESCAGFGEDWPAWDDQLDIVRHEFYANADAALTAVLSSGYALARKSSLEPRYEAQFTQGLETE